MGKQPKKEGRRSDGEGSIYQQIRRGKPVFVAQLRWMDPDGRARVQTAQRSNKSEALEALRRMRVTVATQMTIATAKERAVTVGDALAAWISEKERTTRRSTITVYRAAKSHLAPLAGNRIASLTRADIRVCLDREALSDRMRVLMRTVLRAALRPHHRIIHDDLFPPRGTVPHRRRSLDVWSPEQAVAFLRHVRGHRLALLFQTALHTGLRRGEILGLRWRDVHSSWIEISGSLDIFTGEVAQTKTGGSRRRVDLDAELSAELNSGRGKPTDFVFADDDERPLYGRSVLRQFRAAVQAANRAEADEADREGREPVEIPAIRFHGMRHTHATALLRANVHPKVVSERLGHTSIKLTLDTYSHAIPSMQTAAAAVIGDLFAVKSQIKSQTKPKLRAVG